MLSVAVGMSAALHDIAAVALLDDSLAVGATSASLRCQQQLILAGVEVHDGS